MRNSSSGADERTEWAEEVDAARHMRNRPTRVARIGSRACRSAFHLSITALSWLLFLTSRANALRGRMGNREPEAPVVLLAVPGRNVYGVPEPNV